MDTLKQFKIDLRKDFIEMIQKEVKTQIHTQMQALRQELTTLSNKIDSMKHDIQASIGSIVKDAIMQSFSQHSPNIPYQDQMTDDEPDQPTFNHNSQDGSCPMSTGTGI